MSDITSSENKRQMNIVIAEAKKVISDYDEQIAHQSEGFNSVQSQSQNMSKLKELNTPPPHAIKSPN